MKERSRGFTITEVIVATLIMAMTTFGLFSAILAARKTQSSSDRRQMASFYVHYAREALKNYLIAFDNPPGRPALVDLQALAKNICGGAPVCPTVNNCACATFTGPLDTCAVKWALVAGCTHDFTQNLPATFTGAPFNGTLTYVVTNTGANNTESSVSMTVNWTEIAP